MKFLALVVFCLSLPVLSFQEADLVLVSGRIITLDPTKPRAEAIATKAGRILAVGDTDEIKPHIGRSTKIIDIAGATAIPGFIEGHGHLMGIGESKMILDLRIAKNWEHIIKMVANAVKTTPKGEWITGRGWHQDKWDKIPPGAVEGYPIHTQLSAVSPDHPVMLVHASGHALFANEKAMALAGLTKNTPDPAGGKIVRGKDGSATGVFEETAEELIAAVKKKADSKKSPEAKRARSLRGLELAVNDCLSKGITSFHDAGVTFKTLDLYKELADSHKLKIRLWVMAGEKNEELAKNLANYQLRGYGNQFLTLGGIKRYMDGALGSRGAWLLEPYEDLPGATGQNVTPLQKLAETARLAKKHQLQLCVHAIGDRGNREVLDLYEKEMDGKPLRWRIEHAQHIHPDDIPRFSELGVIASMQGVHCTSDAPFVEKRLGPKRAEAGAYVWRKLIESGALVTNGTDAPVEDVSPLASYYSMVTRKSADGNTFYAAQSLNPMEALKAYTLNNAYAAFEEKEKGSLETGKLADITVLSKDITNVDPESILKTKVLYTIVGGKIVYRGR